MWRYTAASTWRNVYADSCFVNHLSSQPTRHRQHADPDDGEHQRRAGVSSRLPSQPDVDCVERDRHQVDRHMRNRSLLDCPVGQRQEVDQTWDGGAKRADEAPNHRIEGDECPRRGVGTSRRNEVTDE